LFNFRILSACIWKSEKPRSIFTATAAAATIAADTDTASDTTASYYSYSAFAFGAENFTILPRAEINV